MANQPINFNTLLKDKDEFETELNKNPYPPKQLLDPGKVEHGAERDKSGKKVFI